MDDEMSYQSPALSPAKTAYLATGLDAVQGWLVPSTALYLAGLEQAQRGAVAGGLCEIGVHRGKSFLAMAIDAPAGDAAVAIDVFDLQHLNEDGTSSRALEDFRDNLRAWGLDDRVEVVQGSSLELEADGFLDAGPRFRLFSVDGGHGADYVLNDLRIAEATLAPGGVVAADDVFNIHWLGVCTGVFRYFQSGGTLVPFALIPNKLLLTDPGSVETNRERMRALFAAGLTKTDVPMLDGVIDVYGDVPWEVVDDTGHRAPLQRPDDSIDAVRAELTGAQLELARLRTKLREVQDDKRTLQRRLRRLREAAPPATTSEPAEPSSGGLRRKARDLLRGER
jgi:predicted O-methyltransferase YrrM